MNHALNVLEPRFSSGGSQAPRGRGRRARLPGLSGRPLALDLRRPTPSSGVNAELDRRAKVVGIFPNTASLLRLFTAVLQDQHDEWQDGRRHFSQQSMARVMHPDGPPLLTNPLTEGLRRVAHRRCENSTEFTPLPGT